MRDGVQLRTEAGDTRPAPRPADQERASIAGVAPNGLAYALDVAQRWILFLDALRERGNNMLDREAAGMPPLLHFDAEVVCDARRFDRPVNYALLRITGCPHHLEQFVRPDTRPVVVIDPRAGHGPGIGGLRRDSEIGVAMRLGHPVYFVSFFPEPCPGQSLGDVLIALERFVDEVIDRHPGKAPVLYGNCQAGWAVALLCAKCSTRIRGPAILNGSPLSYWATASDAGSSRTPGFLLGGAWLAHYLADLGHGRFDGAWLALNFEAMNVRHAVWDRLAALFASPESERERFLEFERWWSSFYSFSREEICAIVENLFIGNQLEAGELRLDRHCVIDLRLVRAPLVVFASSGDSITPPGQALNWIRELYPDTDALRAAGQRIVYLINPSIGHLGLFISASVALREHAAILNSVDEIERLSPGLYEMVLDGSAGGDVPPVRFEPRRVEDLPFDYDPAPFEAAAEVSTRTALAYDRFLAPWVRLMGAPWNASLAHWFHPMRWTRWAFSDRVNPWMSFAGPAAELVRRSRLELDAEHPLLAAERAVLSQIAEATDLLLEQGRAWQEASFDVLYGGEPHRNDRRRQIPPVAHCAETCACPPDACRGGSPATASAHPVTSAAIAAARG